MTEEKTADIGELVKRIEYVVGNPSAWEAYDEGKSEMLRGAARALTALEARCAELETRNASLIAEYERAMLQQQELRLRDRIEREPVVTDEMVQRVQDALTDRQTIGHDAYGAQKAIGVLKERDKLLETLAAENEALMSTLKRHRSDREYVIGWNDGFDHSIKEDLKFPTMLRKMWSGGEVQKWLDEQFAARRTTLNRLETSNNSDVAAHAITSLEAAGYRILAPGGLDSETLEAAAAKADMWDTTAAGMISKAIRNLRSAG